MDNSTLKSLASSISHQSQGRQMEERTDTIKDDLQQRGSDVW